MISFPGPTSALVTLPVDPDSQGLARVLELERLVLETVPVVSDTIPAFNRLLIEGEAASWDPEQIERSVGTLVSQALEASVSVEAADVVTLPVCYAPELAPDLESVARTCGLELADVSRLHADRPYTVLATGFAPGFAYLGDTDVRLVVPRRETPRARVEAGDVGIADRRTGVYPAAGPGGWNLIGRVPPALFDDAIARIERFAPGGTVRFQPITRADFEAEA